MTKKRSKKSIISKERTHMFTAGEPFNRSGDINRLLSKEIENRTDYKIREWDVNPPIIDENTKKKILKKCCDKK